MSRKWAVGGGVAVGVWATWQNQSDMQGRVKSQGIQCQDEAFQFRQLKLRCDRGTNDLGTCPVKPRLQGPEITHSELMWPQLYFILFYCVYWG